MRIEFFCLSNGRISMFYSPAKSVEALEKRPSIGYIGRALWLKSQENLMIWRIACDF